MSDPTFPTEEDIHVALDVLEAARAFYDDEGTTEQLNQAHYTLQLYEEAIAEMEEVD